MGQGMVRLSRSSLNRSITDFFTGKTFLILYAIIPILAFAIMMWFYPTFYGFYASFTRWNPVSGTNPNPNYIGLKNYEMAFEPDTARREDLVKAIQNSFVYAIFTVGVGTPVALVFALLINSLRKGRSFFRLVYFLPVVTSTIAIGIIWKFLYQPQFGLFNAILRMINDNLHLNITLPGYLLDPKIALFCIGVMTIWQELGYFIVILMAGLSGIPSEYYEAASIDGADFWSRFRYITLPLLQPTLLFIAVTSIAGALQVFDAIYILAPVSTDLGGPARSTLTIVPLIYNRAFPYGGRYEFGYSSALAVIIFIIILAISLFQLRIGRRRWEY